MNQKRLYPELAVFVASAAWGLFWIPLRAFERAGLGPAWASLTQFLAPCIILIPFAVWRRLHDQPIGIRQYRTGLLIGTAVALYLESLLLTDVARALILFYVMPAWGTILEVVFMGQPLTRWRVISLLLSLSGMLIILGVGDPRLFSLNIGDLMALISGILFSLGAMQVRQSKEISVFEQVFAFFLFGSLTALLLSLLPLAVLGQPPSAEELVALFPWIALVAGGFLIPVMWGIYWGSQNVDPGRLGILLQIEAVVGIGSAALFAGEPFGMRQAIGAVLVVSAGIVEVVRNR
jgi:drug/metabolite transporter (DMT)-like permease